MHFKGAGIEKFVMNQHKYINYRSKGEGLTVCDSRPAKAHYCNMLGIFCYKLVTMPVQ